MTEISEIPAQKIESKSYYLEKFSPQDKENLEQLIQLFNNSNENGRLDAVGGTVNKPFPRKDIDILVTFNQISENFDRHQTAYEKAVVNFSKFNEKIIQLIKDSDFNILNIKHPEQDYNYPAIPRNDGSIIISRNNATPIELIRNSSKNVVSDPDHPAIMLLEK